MLREEEIPPQPQEQRKEEGGRGGLWGGKEKNDRILKSHSQSQHKNIVSALVIPRNTGVGVPFNPMGQMRQLRLRRIKSVIQVQPSNDIKPQR